MPNAWMVRAGRNGVHADEFEEGYVAIGWPQLGNYVDLDPEALRKKYIEVFGNQKPSKTNNAIAILLKFRDQIQKGDYIVSYNPSTRFYSLGTDTGELSYDPEVIESLPNSRKVEWMGKISRDTISQKSKNSLGSTLTLFAVNDDVLSELLTILTEGASPKVNESEEEGLVVDQLKDETVEQSHELIKDKIIQLSPDEMEELVAAALRAMGYKAKVSPKGPDRGVDVLASPDGLGLTQPRIKAEVKHRSGATGAPAVRGFIGALREGDAGLFVSTGGFSKEARYEAERSTFPLTLIDLDDLTDLIVSNYENFDVEGKALVPLVRIYWPVN